MDDIKTKCYELNIAPPDNPFPTGSFVGRQKAKEVPERAGEWQSFEATLDGAEGDGQAQRRGGADLRRSRPRSAAASSACSSTPARSSSRTSSSSRWAWLRSSTARISPAGRTIPESKSKFTVNDKGETARHQHGPRLHRIGCSSSATSCCSSSASATLPASTAASSSAAFRANS